MVEGINLTRRLAAIVCINTRGPLSFLSVGLRTQVTEPSTRASCCKATLAADRQPPQLHEIITSCRGEGFGKVGDSGSPVSGKCREGRSQSSRFQVVSSLWRLSVWGISRGHETCHADGNKPVTAAAAATLKLNQSSLNFTTFDRLNLP